MTKVSEIYDRIMQVGSFECKITSLLTLHNHIVLAREKKDAHSLLVFDVSESLSVIASNDIKVCFTETTANMGKEQSKLELYRCQMLNLSQLLDSKDLIKEFKQQILFKYVFLVGISTQLLESDLMLKFLATLLSEQMQPRQVNILRDITSKSQIEQKGYSHLLLQDRKLPLFPSIMLRAKDFHQQNESKILLTSF